MRIAQWGLPVALLLGSFASTAAVAAGDALIIGNSRYGAVQSFFGAGRVVAAGDTLRDAGVAVTDVSDADGPAMEAAFAAFVDGIAPGDAPLIVVLAGAFLHGPNGTYLLPVDEGQTPDAAAVLTRAFPIDAALTVLAQRPGRSFLVLGETASDVDAGPYLKAGIGEVEAPQGVTIIRGPAPDVAAYAMRDMTRADVRVARAAQIYELEIAGYNPADLVLLRSEDVTEREGDRTTPDPLAAEQADSAAWRLAQQADNADGYRTYLEGFPQGQHASAARQRLTAIADEPFYSERRVEEALNLSRDVRRAVQRNLTILGYNTRGIDGIFGPGTRGAVKAWQKEFGQRPSGYLDQSQIAALDRAAAARAAELEAEAARRAAELERQDNALWAEVQTRADEASLRRYLEAYPEGLHANRARSLLADIEEERAGAAALQDRRAWDQARSTDTVKAYRTYLDAQPEGAFIGQAEARIRDLRREENAARDNARAKAEEDALRLNPVAARLAEARLKQLGLKPGKVDGNFDKRTRQAIRTFQRERGLTVSGYLDEQTVVRLLADGILGR